MSSIETKINILEIELANLLSTTTESCEDNTWSTVITSELNELYTQYLNSTDWYITRQTETGKEPPAEILTKRQKVRGQIIEIE
tara:strand:- start:93 stop:344 length:252 start_codon:yes stop_codon:yes gene_type:complete